MDHSNEIVANYILENIGEFLNKNIVAISSMVGGIVLGQTEPHRKLADYLTDPNTIGLIKDYVSIVLAVGGFIIMLINTFRKKKK